MTWPFKIHDGLQCFEICKYKPDLFRYHTVDPQVFQSQKKSSKIGGNCRLLDTFHSLSTGPNSEWTTVTTSTVGIAICKNTWHFERRAFPYRIFVRDECTCKGKQRAQKHNFPGKVTCERYKKNTPQLPKNDSSQTLPAAPIPFNHYLAGKSLTCDVGVGAVDRWLRKGMRPRSVAGDLWSWEERWEGNRVSKKNILPALITDKLYVFCIVSVLDFSTSMMLVYFRLSLFRETPKKKNTWDLHKLGCQYYVNKKRANFSVRSERLLPAKGFRWAPNSCGTTSAWGRKGIWLLFSFVASVVSLAFIVHCYWEGSSVKMISAQIQL